ncbi:MAG: hypothetical protein ABFS46_08375 [Myxococcota bacterium]
MYQSKNHPSRSRTLPMLLTSFLGVAVAGVFACSDSPTQVATDGLSPQLDHKGTPHGNPGPKPSDPGVPLRITLVSGAFTGDGSNLYDETVEEGVATHLAGVNGNLMFDLRESERFVQVTAVGFNGLAKTRTFTNNGPTSDGLRGMSAGDSGSAVLESEWRDGDFFYSLRYGKDCLGNVAGLKAGVSLSADGSTWTVTGVSGVLCRKKQKGKPGLAEVGSGGAFVMTLEKI